MCGIVGTLAFNSSRYEVSAGLLATMRDSIAHRGPDGAGQWISPDRKIGLGHRRLSIIDLSAAANQPMSNEDDSLWIVFNGEIYNHADVRQELEARGGHRWKTDHSDTEVILHGFEEWGIECVHRLRGMFAFALWDAKRRELWLVRDRIGVKPLYYSIHHGRISFASEIKALLKDPEQRRVVDEEALYHYLSFLTPPAPQTLFAGIRKLPPATWMRVGAAGGVTESRYWDVWQHAGPLPEKTEDDVAARLLAELRTAVKLRKVSDVPVGVFLSGGIDSSVNAALFSEGESRPVRTFSVGYDSDYSSYRNEFQYAHLMAATVGAEHHDRVLTEQDVIDFLPRMVQLQDEPIGDPVCVPVYYVSELARRNGVVVCQLGEGSDELFWGYPEWKIKLRLQQMNDLPVPRLFKRAGLAALRAAGHDRKLPYEFLRRGTEGLPVFWGGVDGFTETQKQRLLSPRLRQQLAGVSSWHALNPIYQRFRQNAWDTSHLSWMSYVDLNLRLPELLLMRVDKMSMGVGLEGRVPFLDHKFVEFAMSIPPAMKTRGGELKHILKKAVRGVIPEELIYRKKQGFGVPVHDWLFGKLGRLIRSELASFCDATDLLDRDEVLRLVDNEPRHHLWYLLNLALWWREYVAEDRPALVEASAS